MAVLRSSHTHTDLYRKGSRDLGAYAAALLLANCLTAVSAQNASPATPDATPTASPQSTLRLGIGASGSNAPAPPAGGIGVGAIAGIAAGLGLGLLAIAALVGYFLMSRKKGKSEKSLDPELSKYGRGASLNEGHPKFQRNSANVGFSARGSTRSSLGKLSGSMYSKPSPYLGKEGSVEKLPSQSSWKRRNLQYSGDKGSPMPSQSEQQWRENQEARMEDQYTSVQVSRSGLQHAVQVRPGAYDTSTAEQAEMLLSRQVPVGESWGAYPSRGPSRVAMNERAVSLPDGQRLVIKLDPNGSVRVRHTKRASATDSSPQPSSSQGSSMDSHPARGMRTPPGRSGSLSSSGALPDLNVDDWEISPADLRICTKSDGSPWRLGQGGFGAVFKGLLHGVHTVAVKKFLRVTNSKEELEVLKEVAILKACRNAHVVNFVGACVDVEQNTLMIVTEFFEGGDLWHALGNNDTYTEFSWYNRGCKIALDIAKGLSYLHHKQIVHFDLKSPNVLLTADGSAAIADVGFSRILNNQQSHISNAHAATYAYAAPEVLMGKACNEKVDIYSLGVVLWEVATGEQPKRCQLTPCKVPEECPAEVEALIRACLQVNPDDRPTAREVKDILSSVEHYIAPPGAGYCR